MTIQVYVDESGNKGDTRHFVMVGLVGHAEDWVSFSEEWAACLKRSPAIRAFKMKDAASCTGQFYGVSKEDRDKKLRELCKIINQYVEFMTFSVIELKAHEETWGKLNKPHNEPYFFPFQNTILAACFSLWDSGWRERFEIIYDENVIFGLRAIAWYPVAREVCKFKEPKASTILPEKPIFRSDEEDLPIQAADLFAWCIRKATDNPEDKEFEWLLGEMSSITQSKYNQYYDKERMEAVLKEALENLKEDRIPPKALVEGKKIKGKK